MAEQLEKQQSPLTNSERLVAIETLLPTLATKTDVANIMTHIESLRSEIKTLRWLIVVAIAVTGIVVQYLNQGRGIALLFDERNAATKATLSQLATKADVKRQTKILVFWLIATQIALFAALSCFLGRVLEIAPVT